MSKKNAQSSRAQRAAGVIEEQGARERRRRLLIVGGIVAALVLAVVVGLVVQAQRDTTGEAATTPAGASDDFGLVLGEDDAPHSVVIYEDFLCPVCAQFEALTDTGLSAAVESGQVQVEYRTLDFLSRFGDYSLRAANAFAVVLDAAGPEAAKELHDTLFALQPPESGPFPDDEALVDAAVEAGVEEEQVREGIEDLQFEQWVANATDQASRDGVRGTPTVMLDGEPLEGRTLEEMAVNLLQGIG